MALSSNVFASDSNTDVIEYPMPNSLKEDVIKGQIISSNNSTWISVYTPIVHIQKFKSKPMSKK